MGGLRHNPYMNTPNEFEARLLKADPAQNTPAPALSEEIVWSASKSKPKLDLRQQFELLTARARGFALGGLVSGAAAIVAVTIVVNPTPAPLIQLAASQEGDANRSQVSLESSEDKMMIMPFVTYEYLVGPELSNEAGSGQVYKLVRTGTPESVLENLAGVFGIQGSVKKYADYSEEYRGYFFGETDDPWGVDNLSPTVSIWWNGTASWNYSNPESYMSSLDCAVLDAEGYCQEYVEIVATPELLPSKEEAISTALRVFNSTGLMATESDLRVDYSEWGVSISSSFKVDGQPTSIEWYIGWSSNGELSYAGGHSVVAEAAGDFGTISPVQAVERLDDWRWFGSPASFFYESGLEASTGSAYDRSEVMVEPGVSNSEGETEAEIVTLTVVSSEKALLSVWDSSGDVWLVPGLLLFNDQGWWSSVISVIEGVIALPEPSAVDIMPMPGIAPDDSSVSNK